MKYNELIQFEPVTEVIQLSQANDKDIATQLVETFVISDRMADVIINRIVPELRIDIAAGGRGLFIVGNYGTGKSHLMSIISAAAEYPDLAEKVKHPAVADGLKKIAGRYIVIRQETGSTGMNLRDLVLTDLERQLKNLGFEYHFPPYNETPSNKYLLLEMMSKFQTAYPGKGLLILLDELLDFLGARKDQELRADLNFLREVGEACEQAPLRFITGIQEALFDNPRFAFAADSIRRVRARFDQVSIVREDIAYVVTHRLLVKTKDQTRKIRAHLERFTPLYDSMAERLDQFVELFPVHPGYIEVFEQVTIGERRDLLKALSEQMLELLDRDVPETEPGLIAFDAYWRKIKEDSAYRTIPAVRLVEDKAKVLTERIEQSPGMKDYREPALRIIDGLALHRLTLTDIYSPIGLTPVELRDRLCLYLPLPEEDADFLLATIETVLKEISRAVSGQFISHNPENDQYYLDLKKDIDFDALIEQRAAALDKQTLDRYYFDVLAYALELKEASYVPGFRIWPREIPWQGHGITRQGYIFLGAPNERSTAHPARDFYVHFLGFHGNGWKPGSAQSDEVYFSLDKPDDTFLSLWQKYSGAKEMSAISSGSNKDQYDRKADQYLRQLTNWLRENFLRVFKIRYLDEEMTGAEAVGKMRITFRETNFRDLTFRLCGMLLDDHFRKKYPDYPNFEGIEFTSETMPAAADAALKAITGGPVTRTVQAVMEGLKLAKFLNGQLQWSIEQSQYASHFEQLINHLDGDRVINRFELVDGEPGAEKDKRFGLEPEWVVVILAALVRQGTIVINLPGRVIAEGELSEAARMGLDQLWKFTSIGRPKPMPEAALRVLFEALNIDTALLDDPHLLDTAVNQLQQNLQSEVDAAVRMRDSLRDGPRFWRESVLKPEEQRVAVDELTGFVDFLNSLQHLSSPARLRNLKPGVGEIRSAFKARKKVAEINQIFDLIRPLQAPLEYVYQAQTVLPPNHSWQSEADRARIDTLNLLRDPQQRTSDGLTSVLKGKLENLQNSYMQAYYGLHQNARLDRGQDERKRQLTADSRWAKMRALSKLDLLPERQLEALEQSLSGIQSCSGLQLTELRAHTNCPHCGFAPAVEPSKESAHDRLEAASSQFEALCQQWLEILLTNLNVAEAQINIPMLDAKERQAVEEFITTKVLPGSITGNFLNGVQNALLGLEKVEIDANEFLLALTKAGMPCTPDELEGRIRAYLQDQLQGKDRRKVRIQIDW